MADDLPGAGPPPPAFGLPPLSEVLDTLHGALRQGNLAGLPALTALLEAHLDAGDARMRADATLRAEPLTARLADPAAGPVSGPVPDTLADTLADPAATVALRRRLDRNAACLDATLRGMRAARRRLAEIAAAARGLSTYGARGQRIDIGAAGGGLIHRL